MEATLYNSKGKKAGTVALPEAIFGLKWNADLVHQVVTSMQANARTSSAHTKDRSEVRGGGKKPWKQKGTGRARHGSSRSPIWTHGGVAHGPRNEKSYLKTTTKQMRQKALLVTIARKFADNEIIFLNELHLETPKARDAKEIIKALSSEFAGLSKTKNSALIALPRKDVSTHKSFQNFSNLSIIEARDLNPVKVLEAKYLILPEPEAVFEMLGAKKVMKKKTK